jgi:hypothetical protein
MRLVIDGGGTMVGAVVIFAKQRGGPVPIPRFLLYAVVAADV